MIDLTNATEADLVAELERRKTATAPPQPLPNPDFLPVLNMIVEGTQRTIKNGYEDDDLRAYVYEAAIRSGLWKGLLGMAKQAEMVRR